MRTQALAAIVHVVVKGGGQGRLSYTPMAIRKLGEQFVEGFLWTDTCFPDLGVRV